MVKANRNTLATITYSLALTIMVGWLLETGRSVLLPVMVAIIAVYVLVTAADAMIRLPVVGRLGRGWRRVIVLILFIVVVIFLGGIVASNSAAITAKIPDYVANLDLLEARLVAALGLDDAPSIADYSDQVLEWLDLTALLPSIVSTLTGSSTMIVTAALYAAFILADLDNMPAKVRKAMGDTEWAEQTLDVTQKINARIGDYLAAKTLVNVILGFVSYLAMWLLGIEHAVFWALLIGLLNYIPYVGSVFAVALPVTMSLVQFASPLHSLLTLVALIIPQILVGYVIEPKFLGKSVNMSPFTVLLSLAVWTALWGLTGAVLAIPLTAIVVIVLAEFEGTRFISVMLSNDGEV